MNTDAEDANLRMRFALKTFLEATRSTPNSKRMVGTDSVVRMGNSMQNRSPFGALPPNNSGFSHFDGEGTPFRGGECESYSQTSMGDKNNTPDMTRSSTITSELESGPAGLKRLRSVNERQKKDDDNTLHYVQTRMREAKRIYESKKREKEEAEEDLRQLEAKKRRLNEELQPMKTKNLELNMQLEAAKKRGSISKAVSLILEQDDPHQFVREIAGKFGWKLEPLQPSQDVETLVKHEEEVEEQPSTTISPQTTQESRSRSPSTIHLDLAQGAL